MRRTPRRLAIPFAKKLCVEQEQLCCEEGDLDGHPKLHCPAYTHTSDGVQGNLHIVVGRLITLIFVQLEEINAFERTGMIASELHRAIIVQAFEAAIIHLFGREASKP